MEEKEIESFLRLVQKGDLFSIHNKYNNRLDVNNYCRKKSGDSPLHIAARFGHLDVFKFLVEEGDGNIELCNCDEKTPLHDAAQFSQLDILNYLIERGVNINAVKKGDWTPLMLSCTKTDLNIVSKLLEAGSDINFRNKDGWNSLHIAAREGNLPIIQLLLKFSQTPQQLIRVKSKNGRTPFHTAVMHGHLPVVKYFLDELQASECEEIVNELDSCRTSGVMDACRFGFDELMELLIGKYSASISATNQLGMNSLHIAAEAGQILIIELLVQKYNMDVNILTTESHLTPLHFAIRENQVDAVNILLKLGGDLYICDKNGLNCIEYGIRLKKDFLVELIRR